MRVLIDTNVILDVLCNRPNFVETSSKILKFSELGIIEGYASALSVSNIIYIMRKELTREKTKKIISTLFLILTIADLKADDLFNAMSSNYTDYEDAIQEACATRIKADYIVTRNIKVFIEGSVQAIEPSEFLKILDL